MYGADYTVAIILTVVLKVNFNDIFLKPVF